MATSGTTAFDLQIDDIIEEAYERCGMRTNSGNDLRSARRSLNLLFSEWGNRGIHLWKVQLNEQALTAGTATYTVATDVNDVLEAYISTTAAASDSSSTNDIALTKIDRSAYAALPNKLQTGQPSQYYVDRQTTPTISLYLAPDATTYTTLKFYTINRIEDAGGFTNTADVAYRFLPCMCSGLAYYLSQKRAPDRIQLLKQLYEDELIRALNEDGSRTSVYISPQSYFPGGGIMSFATGKRSQAISDRSGQAFPYKEMVKEWTGALVHISEYEPKHPQLDPPYHKADAVALKNTRSQRFSTTNCC
jgi:hypothetical protein